MQQIFDYYSPDELKSIKVNGIQPEDMTRWYDVKYIEDKRLKKNLKGDGDICVLSTQFKKPKYKFNVGQEVLIDYGYDEKAVCIGSTQRAIRGIRCICYFFQLI